MGLFYFKQFQTVPPAEVGGKPSIMAVEDFIDPDMILRGRTFPDGSSIVLLKDGHETVKAVPVLSKNGVQSKVNEKVWVQTELNLSAEDTARLKKLMDFDYDIMPKNDGKEEDYTENPGQQEMLPEPEVQQIGPNDKY